jgi:hypothetical protein
MGIACTYYGNPSIIPLLHCFELGTEHLEMTSGTIKVAAGELTALRLFDIAYTVDLSRAEQLWAARPGLAFSRSRLTSTPAKAVTFGVAPLHLQLGETALTLDSPTPTWKRTT